jgi:uncharacterized protein YbjT (DUF2867 family)
VARVLIVGGGCRGRRLASALVHEGHAVRISTRSEAGRTAIEAAGAECWIGTPDRLATLRAALEGVAILCWLLGSAAGPEGELRELHTSRLRFFLTQAIDTTVRGFVYEARGSASPPGLLAEGEQIARALTEQNAIPATFLTGDPADASAWLGEARSAIDSLLSPG